MDTTRSTSDQEPSTTTMLPNESKVEDLSTSRASKSKGCSASPLPIYELASLTRRLTPQDIAAVTPEDIARLQTRGFSAEELQTVFSVLAGENKVHYVSQHAQPEAFRSAVNIALQTAATAGTEEKGIDDAVGLSTNDVVGVPTSSPPRRQEHPIIPPAPATTAFSSWLLERFHQTPYVLHQLLMSLTDDQRTVCEEKVAHQRVADLLRVQEILK